MLLAEALSRISVGRAWERTAVNNKELAGVVQLFADQADAPLSLHRICTAGLHAGMVPGRWVGPWMLCKSFERLFSSCHPLGLRVYVACDPMRGGAPELDVAAISSLLTPEAQQEGTRDPAPSTAADGTDAAAAPEASSAGGGAQPADCLPGHACSKPQACAEASHSAAAEQACEAAHEPQHGSNPGAVAHDSERSQCGSGHGSGQAGPSGRAPGPLLLLVPLTLGIDKINPLYQTQLQRVLTFPQSVGIVGGRPSASLYVVGYQEASPPPAAPVTAAAGGGAGAGPQAGGSAREAQFLYLDPHAAQPATQPPNLDSYFCDVVRLLSPAGLDPSLAIGFLCRDLGEFQDLCTRLQQLAQEHRSAPLMTLAAGGRTAPHDSAGPSLGDGEWEGGASSAAAGEDEWEMVPAASSQPAHGSASG